MKRWLVRLGKLLGLAAIAFVVGLEAWYWSLLPDRLPHKAARPLPGNAHAALKAELGSANDLQPVLVPFLLTYLSYADGRARPTSLAARQHLNELLDSGELQHERSFRFQLRWVALTTWVARHWTVDESVDAVGSRLWTGGTGVGLESGSQRLFGRPLAQVNNADLALLLAVTDSPRSFDPACHPARAAKRRACVLEKFAAHGVISSAEANELKARPITTVIRCSGARSVEGGV